LVVRKEVVEEIVRRAELFVKYGRPLPGKKGKAVPLQAWSGPEGSRKSGFPDYMTTAQDGGKIVSLTHRPPRKCSWYSFLLEAELTPGS
jgi:hypothetical protein